LSFVPAPKVGNYFAPMTETLPETLPNRTEVCPVGLNSRGSLRTVVVAVVGQQLLPETERRNLAEEQGQLVFLQSELLE
jgi:hypothetical protein